MSMKQRQPDHRALEQSRSISARPDEWQEIPVLLVLVGDVPHSELIASDGCFLTKLAFICWPVFHFLQAINAFISNLSR